MHGVEANASVKLMKSVTDSTQHFEEKMQNSGQDGSSILEPWCLCQLALSSAFSMSFCWQFLYRKLRVFFLIWILTHSFIYSVLSIRHDYKKGPMKNGCRKWIIHFMYHVSTTFFLFVAGMRTSVNYVDLDYSEYLGPDYKNNQKKIKRTSTIVCNHVSWLDAVILIKNIRPAFAPS